MAGLRFFDQGRNSLDEAKKFHLKLKKAHELIKKNKSHRAKKALEALNDNKLRIHSFFELNKKHYQQIAEEYSLHAAPAFPLGSVAVHTIESQLDGVIFDNTIIYLNSMKSPVQMANTLINEINRKASKVLSSTSKIRCTSDKKAAARLQNNNNSFFMSNTIKTIQEGANGLNSEPHRAFN